MSFNVVTTKGGDGLVMGPFEKWEWAYAAGFHWQNVMIEENPYGTYVFEVKESDVGQINIKWEGLAQGVPEKQTSACDMPQSREVSMVQRKPDDSKQAAGGKGYFFNPRFCVNGKDGERHNWLCRIAELIGYHIGIVFWWGIFIGIVYMVSHFLLKG